jgi:prevent-host-death family protein
VRPREGLAEIVNRVAYGHERVVLGRRGRALVALIPAEDLELLEQLEDAADLRGAIGALVDSENQGPPVTLADLRARIAEREGRQSRESR